MAGNTDVPGYLAVLWLLLLVLVIYIMWEYPNPKTFPWVRLISCFILSANSKKNHILQYSWILEIKHTVSLQPSQTCISGLIFTFRVQYPFVFVQYFCAFGIILLVPLDLSMTIIARRSQDDEKYYNDNVRTVIDMYLSLYWPTLVLSNIVLPIQEQYNCDGKL